MCIPLFFNCNNCNCNQQLCIFFIVFCLKAFSFQTFSYLCTKYRLIVVNDACRNKIL